MGLLPLVCSKLTYMGLLPSACRDAPTEETMTTDEVAQTHSVLPCENCYDAAHDRLGSVSRAPLKAPSRGGLFSTLPQIFASSSRFLVVAVAAVLTMGILTAVLMRNRSRLTLQSRFSVTELELSESVVSQGPCACQTEAVPLVEEDA